MKTKIDDLTITAEFVDDIRTAKLKFMVSDGNNNSQEIDVDKVIALTLLQISRSLKFGFN